MAPTPVWRHWTTADGLPVNGINGIERTTDGYLWLASWDGLVRFDGVRFTTFDATTNPELGSDRFTALFRSGDDTLWLTTEYHDLIRFRDGRFEAVVTADAGRRATMVAPASGDTILFGLGDQVMKIAAGRVETLVAGIPGEVMAVHEGPEGQICAGTDRGEIYRVETGEPVRVDIVGDGPDGTVSSLLATGDGDFLVGTSLGLWRLSAGGVSSQVPLPMGSSAGVLAIERDPVGRIWVVTATDLLEFGEDALVHRAGVSGLNGNEPLSIRCPIARVCVNASPRLLADDREILDAGSTIKDLLVDQEGSLWVATAAEGLYQLRTAGILTLDHEEGLPGDNIYPVVEAPEGSFWVGTGAGLARLGDGEVDVWPGNDALPFQAVWTILVDREGQVWVGGDGGLCRLAGKRCLALELPASDYRADVRALYEDDSGRIWIGAYTGVFVLENGSVSRVDGFGAASGGRTVRTILQAADGALWMGSAGAGLFRVSGQAIERVTTADGLASNLIRALHEDRQGRLWVGSEGRGLCRISDPGSAARRIDCVDASRGLYDNGIHRILEDDLGRYWMSTNRGVFHVDMRQLNAVLDDRVARLDSRSFTERDGLPHREANGGVQSAGLRSSDGRLWFPTQAGVAVIDPDHFPPLPAPVPVFERVEAGGVIAGNPTGVVELARGARDVDFGYTAPSFLVPGQIRFRHRLVGYDRAWIEAGGRRETRYTNLPPGRYTFQVEARSADGLRSRKPAQLAIVIPAYPWETAWFRSGVFLALLAAAGWMVYRRVRAQVRRQHQLEREVEARTADLEQQKAATERALETVREQHQLLEAMSEAKMRFFANVSHELRTPLTLLLGPLREAAVAGGSLPAGEHEVMLRNAVRLERLLDLIRDLQKIDAGGFRLRFERLDIAALTTEVTTAFAPLAERKGVDLACRVPEEAVAADGDYEQIERIVGNLLSNAIKFTPPGGAVELRLEVSGAEVGLSVIDDGPGIPAESVRRIFERFFQLDPSGERASEGMGIGLAMARELARLHGGDIEVTGAPGRGSRFTLHWPRFRADTSLESDTPRRSSGTRPGVVASVVEPAPADSSADERRTVLVVDDNADIRTFVRRILEPEWRVLEAADGQDALELARCRLPDLVLADVMMPGMDGFELARRLRGDPETGAIPLIFLTARAENRDQVEGFAAGGDQYVTKPFSPEVLRARVRGLLEERMRLRRRLLEEAERSAAHLDEAGKPDNGIEARARRVIRQHLPDEGFGADRLATELAVSRRQLYRLLAEAGAPRAAELIREERLTRAAALLRAGAGTVAEVAYAVGFASLATFSRVFRDRYGVPPSAYR